MTPQEYKRHYLMNPTSDPTQKLTAWKEAVDYANDLGVPVCRMAAIIDHAKAEAFMKAAAEATERVECKRSIPCPDGKPGCLVSHFVTGTRHRTPEEIAVAICGLIEELPG